MDMQWVHNLAQEALRMNGNDGDRLLHIAHPLAQGINTAIQALMEHLRSAGCDEGFVDSAHLEIACSLLIYQTRTMIQKSATPGAISDEKGKEIGIELRDKIQDAIAEAFQKNLSDYRAIAFDKRKK